MNLTDILHTEVDPEGPLDSENEELADEPEQEVEAGFCVECGDQKADIHCAACEEDFCDVCSTVIHRVGLFDSSGVNIY